MKIMTQKETAIEFKTLKFKIVKHTVQRAFYR